MLRTASSIKGYSVAARDGELGTVSDFLFDDATWLVRWLVVDTGSWLSSRKVLLPPLALGHLDMKERKFEVRLTKQQVEDSPNIDTDQPVSRRMETSTYDYYGWNPYWGTGFYMGGFGYMGGGMDVAPAMSSSERSEYIAHTEGRDGDQHLRSIAAVTGYHIHATDGEVGHVADFLLEETDWSVHFMIVDTSNWWMGKKVLVSPRSAHEIDWSERLVNLDVDRERVQASPPYDPSTLVDRAYEHRFHGYYDNPQAR